MLLCGYLVAFCGHQVSCPENIPCTCCLSGIVHAQNWLINTMTVFFCVCSKAIRSMDRIAVFVHMDLWLPKLYFVICFSSHKRGQISGKFIPIACVCSVFLKKSAYELASSLVTTKGHPNFNNLKQ